MRGTGIVVCIKIWVGSQGTLGGLSWLLSVGCLDLLSVSAIWVLGESGRETGLELVGICGAIVFVVFIWHLGLYLASGSRGTLHR